MREFQGTETDLILGSGEVSRQSRAKVRVVAVLAIRSINAELDSSIVGQLTAFENVMTQRAALAIYRGELFTLYVVPGIQQEPFITGAQHGLAWAVVVFNAVVQDAAAKRCLWDMLEYFGQRQRVVSSASSRLTGYAHTVFASGDSMRQPVELSKAYRLLNHGPTVLITSAHAGATNVMAAAWNMALDFDPPKVCVVIAAGTYTRALVDATGEFALNIPDRSMAATTVAVGECSGKEVNKFEKWGLTTFASEKIAAPLLDGCVGWLECKVIPEPHIEQRYDLFIAEVVGAWADSSVFRRGHWEFGPGAPRSIHYISGGTFFETGGEFEV